MLTRFRLRVGAGLIALLPLLAVALWIPIPRVGNPGASRVVQAASERLPGWSIVRATDTWEGGYAVVASCGPRTMGFQVVPGHGLPLEDAWLQPNDAYADSRLRHISDYPAFLIWRAHPMVRRTLSCSEELARPVTPPSNTEFGSQAAGVRQSDVRVFDERGRRRVD
jgi:hypothetical protein